MTAELLTEVCNDVRVEPDLQPLSGEVFPTSSTNTSNGARLDIPANGFWGGRFEKCFIDVRVFNPHAPSNRQSSLDKCYKKHEQEKRRAYGPRVRDVEHATFTPLVLSASCGLAREASIFYKRLASLLANKWDQPYGLTLHWLRCKIAYSLLRSSFQCLRGARLSRGHSIRSASSPIDLVMTEIEAKI